jgi:TPP-dependent pyruvate/acetoin dehydrogenase alpha subunit
MFDAELYRDKSEVEEWKKRDPIEKLGGALEQAGLLHAPARAELERQIEQEIAEAVAFAEAGTWEPVETLTRDVYTRQP